MSWLKDLLQSGDKIRVLAVTSNALDRISLEGIAARAHWNLKLAPNCETAAAALKHRPPAVIICDRDLPHIEWRETLRFLSLHAPASPIVVISPDTDDRFWLEVIERGGYDVITRPFHENRVVTTVRQASDRTTK